MTRKYDVTIAATFIGKVPSMGFIPGKRYYGAVKHNTFFAGELSCPYSVSGFLTFWNEINVLSRNNEETHVPWT